MLYGSIKIGGLDNYFVPGDAKQMRDGKEWKPQQAGAVEKYAPYVGGLGGAGIGALLGHLLSNDRPAATLAGGLAGGVMGGAFGLGVKGTQKNYRDEKNFDEGMDTSFEGGTPLKHDKFPKVIGGMFSDPNKGGFRGKAYEPYVNNKREDFAEEMYSPRMPPERVKEMSHWLNTHKIKTKGTDAEAYLRDKDVAELGKMFDHYSKQDAAMTAWY